jgi:hypothetical protein
MKKSLSVLVLLAAFIVTPITFAQSPETCEGLSPESLTALQESCADIETGSVCSGEITALEDTLSISDTASILRIDAPHPITLIPFGSVELVNAVEAVELVTFPAINAVGYNVNLREGPGTNFPVVGAFEFNANVLVDGRNADSTWLRLQTAVDIAWVSAEFARVDGDISQLVVLETFYTQPMQAFTFTQNESECGISGLLVQSSDEGLNQIQVNGFDLKLQAASALLQMVDDVLHIHLLAGDIQGTNFELSAGQSAQLTADTEPLIVPAYAFDVLENAPLALLPIAPLACIAGVSEVTAVYPNPNPEASPFAELLPEAHYTVTAQAVDEAENAWWRLDSSQGQAWIPQGDIATLGNCEAVASIDLTAPSTGGGSAPVAGNPESIITSYLNARIASDAGTLQALSCGAWQGQAALQADSFRSMDARLEGLACFQDGSDSTYAYVACSGKIITTYNGQTRDWMLGRYRLTQEGGAWKMCGEAN